MIERFFCLQIVPMAYHEGKYMEFGELLLVVNMVYIRHDHHKILYLHNAYPTRNQGFWQILKGHFSEIHPLQIRLHEQKPTLFSQHLLKRS